MSSSPWASRQRSNTAAIWASSWTSHGSTNVEPMLSARGRTRRSISDSTDENPSVAPCSWNARAMPHAIEWSFATPKTRAFFPSSNPIRNLPSRGYAGADASRALPRPMVLRWIPAIVEMVVLFILSATPNLRISQDPSLDHVLRKLGHAAAYALLAVLVAWAMGGLRGDPRRAPLAFGIVVAYAITDEIHQAFTATRSPSALDVAVDAAGAGIGVLVYRMVERRRAATRRMDDASDPPPL